MKNRIIIVLCLICFSFTVSGCASEEREQEVSKDSEKNMTSSINPASECEWNMDNEKKPDELYGEKNESLLEIPDFMLSKKSDYIATNMNSLFELADVVIVGSLKENVEIYVSDNAIPVTTA